MVLGHTELLPVLVLFSLVCEINSNYSLMQKHCSLNYDVVLCCVLVMLVCLLQECASSHGESTSCRTTLRESMLMEPLIHAVKNDLESC